MSHVQHSQGFFQCGMPYNQFMGGSKTLVVFQGLVFVNQPMPGFMAKKFTAMYKQLLTSHTIVVVNRKPGMAEGMTMTDIAAEYAAMIREEFSGPVDVLGISTGGSLVQHFAADHPDLVNRLVIHSAAHTLNESAKRGQMRVAKLARRKQWRRAYAALMGVPLPENNVARLLYSAFFAVIALLGGRIFGKPTEHPFDVAITIEAEDKHAFKNRLHEIKAPTLVIAGENDPFYSPELFRETAEGIPDCKLALYPGMGHPAMGKEFQAELAAFLR